MNACKQERVEKEDCITSTDEENQAGVQILRDKQGLGFHGDEADVHGPVKNS